MSADNWAVCPRCVKQARAAEAKALAKVMASYGKVPVEEFDRARADVPTSDPEKFRTFREDYEIYGADDGDVVVDYGGSCTECGLHLTFTDHHPIPEIVETGPAS